jgi:lipid-A-disaccharide synthase
VVAVLPGSRRSEIEANTPAFLQAAAILQAQRRELRFVLPIAPGLRAMIEPRVAQHAPQAGVMLLDGRSHEALAACDVTLIASGTATLEAALFKRPMVIAYRMNALSWQIMKRMRLQPWVGLPNILCREFVVPELLQHDATPRALAAAVIQWLDQPARCDALAARFNDLHQLLRRDTARTASDAIATILGH